MVTSSQGHIFSINVSAGGVPKLPLPSAQVGSLGLLADRQANLDVHGGVERAVCLYSLERILALQAEGHPIFPGAIGENITVFGIIWDGVAPGAKLKLGEEVQLQITRYTAPCKTVSSAFKDGYFNRISHQLNPGWSRVYARVLIPGSIRIGDRVILG